MRKAVCSIICFKEKGGIALKKIISFIFASAIVMGMSAFAANASLEDSKVVINHDGGDTVILSAYDANGTLKGSQYLTRANGVFYGEAVAEKDISYRLCDLETGEFFDIDVQDAEPAPPQETVEPTPSPSSLPAAYERELDAVYTFSVIKSVETVADSNNEKAYKVEVLHRGAEETIIVPEDVKIAVSSDYYSDLTGEDASSLEAGDLVYFENNLQGTVRNMALISRIIPKNVITSTDDYGNNFEKLFSTKGRVYASPAKEAGTVIPYGGRGQGRYQFAFGAVMDSGRGYFTLFNKRGRINDAIEVSTTSDTIVYVCDMSGREPKLSISSVGAIARSHAANIDEDGNAGFTEEDSYVCAFARIINGTASEVVIYTGMDA